MFQFREFCVWGVVIFATIETSVAKETIETDRNVKSSIVRDKLKVTIFYESECPDCINFFKDQIQPNYEHFARYLTLDFVPYGKATQKKDAQGNYKFDCQHGELECKENKCQACAINQMHKKPPFSLDNFIACYMSKEKKDQAALKCASQHKLDYEKMKACASSRTGDKLLAKMGDRTHNFRPKIEWIPTIVFNNVYNDNDSKRAAQDLKEILCEKLDHKPTACQ